MTNLNLKIIRGTKKLSNRVFRETDSFRSSVNWTINFKDALSQGGVFDRCNVTELEMLAASQGQLSLKNTCGRLNSH